LLELNAAQKPVEAAVEKPPPAPAPPSITAAPVGNVEAEKPTEAPKQAPPSEPIQVANRTDPRQLEKMANSLRLAGRAYVDRGMYAAAIETLTKALDLDPKSAVAFNSRGYAELRSLDYQAAIGDFSRAIEINPAYANAFWNRGIARRLSGDRDGGRTDMRRAAQLGWPTTPH
jgi:tetratricopeptide (TPR) repeat protein